MTNNEKSVFLWSRFKISFWAILSRSFPPRSDWNNHRCQFMMSVALSRKDCESLEEGIAHITDVGEPWGWIACCLHKGKSLDNLMYCWRIMRIAQQPNLLSLICSLLLNQNEELRGRRFSILTFDSSLSWCCSAFQQQYTRNDKSRLCKTTWLMILIHASKLKGSSYFIQKIPKWIWY